MLLIGAAVIGIDVRRRVWDLTDPVRFAGDVRNGFHWGFRASQQGYFGFYDALAERHRGQENPGYEMDYPPLRLAVMTLWARGVRDDRPGAVEWARDYDFTAPLLRLNTLAAGIGAGGIFLLVRHWSARGGTGTGRTRGDESLGATRRPPDSRVLDGPTVRGLVAAGLYWMNPALLIDAHWWPQWDAWLVPFYVFAAWGASCGRWTAAGVLLGVGVMFKGQLLIAGPVLVLWPLIARDYRAVARVVLGFGLGAGAVVSPWLAANPTARAWVACVLAGGWVLKFAADRGTRGRTWLATAALAVALVSAPLAGADAAAPTLVVAAAVAAGGFAGAMRRIPPPWRTDAVLAAGVVALGLCLPLLDGSRAWFDIGFRYGVRRYDAMTLGTAANLPALLEQRFGWTGGPSVPLVSMPLVGATDLSLRAVLVASYVLALLACAWGAAAFARRNDRRMLVALCAPWLLSYALLPQMAERYVFWIAALSCSMVAVGWGMTILHGILTAVACLTIPLVPLAQAPWFAPRLTRWTHAIYPDVAWAVLACAAVFLLVALPIRLRRADG